METEQKAGRRQPAPVEDKDEMLCIAAVILRGEKKDDLKKSPKGSLRRILFAH